ncbi:MAG: hypothetical protein KF685_13630 [Acidobacteria bacterium]|nr:hypothetical protein [Acidobacteriota bacterium]
MFCPKCGTKNPEDGKYCRSCGADIGRVTAALKGTTSNILSDIDEGLSSWDGTNGTEEDSLRRRDPDEVYGDGIKAGISGLGFLIASMALLITGAAGGRNWWWAFLIPAFALLAKGISDILKSRRMQKSRMEFFASATSLGSAPNTTALPPIAADYVPAAAESRFKTGDLVPSSVTDNTTKLLEIDRDGETRTLPKQ